MLFGLLMALAAGCTTVTRQASAEDVADPPSTSSEAKKASTDKAGASQPSWYGQMFVMFWSVVAGGQR